eukprot:2083213-Rhodomonas_salina.4
MRPGQSESAWRVEQFRPRSSCHALCNTAVRPQVRAAMGTATAAPAETVTLRAEQRFRWGVAERGEGRGSAGREADVSRSVQERSRRPCMHFKPGNTCAPLGRWLHSRRTSDSAGSSDIYPGSSGSVGAGVDVEGTSAWVMM